MAIQFEISDIICSDKESSNLSAKATVKYLIK